MSGICSRHAPDVTEPGCVACNVVLNENPDLDSLRRCCAEYVENVGKWESNDRDHAEYFVFEAAITAFYGHDVWQYIRERLRFERKSPP